jgi:hypothetical protein
MPIPGKCSEEHKDRQDGPCRAVNARRIVAAAIRSPWWCAGPNAISNAIGYTKFRSRSQDAMIRVYDEAGNVIETSTRVSSKRGERDETKSRHTAKRGG